MIFRNLLILIVLAIFCLIFIIGCKPEIIPIPPGPQYREVTEDQIVYSPVNPVNKLSHDDSLKWLRDNGYSVKTNNQRYNINRQNGNNTNIDISVGATVIGVPVYDKFFVTVGSLSVIDGKISVTINRKRTVKPVIKHIPIN